VTRAIVLVVDDEPLNRDLLRRVLHKEYEIREAEDAEAALRGLEADERCDVILCDHIMPGMSGTELARDVRRRWPKLIMVLLTGYEDAPEVTAACSDGLVLEVLGKPWQAPALKAAVLRAVERARGA
jgi:two-component system, NtrC family, response regulator HupR/HoxA